VCRSSQFSPEEASQWQAFVDLIGRLKPSKTYGVKLKLEAEVVLIMPTFELEYDLQNLAKHSRSGFLKTATLLTPSFHSTPLLMG
jgi:hypothetical protein